jgi:ERCC4-related helicase
MNSFLTEADIASIRFNPPAPDPMDFNSIDLKPFEDPSELWTEEYSKSLNLKYHPRDYQIEIIRHAVRNGNTIVCLRTGSGKTFIASVLIKYYFIKKQKANPDSKFLALFFVPRKAIRLQQAKAISEIGNLKVQMCEDDQTIDQLINTNHVIVSTPQKCVNCLKKGTIHLSQIDLMILDECHNTSGGNPYCEIMKYFKCPSRQQNNLDKPPLIIGLTATISAKDTHEKKESIEQNLVSLCSRLGCKTIATVCDPNNITEINREISRPQNDQFEYVSKVQYNSYFDEYLNMFKELIKLIKRYLDNHEMLDGQELGSPGFISQLVLLKQAFETKGEINNIIICDYLLLLTKKYSALKDLPFDMVLKYILQKINEYHQGYKESQPMNNLVHERCKIELQTILKKHAENPTENSKLNSLVNLLKRYAPTNKKGDYFYIQCFPNQYFFLNVGLILVQTTFYAKTLDDYLRKHPELKVRCTYICRY